jgi:hypothetical protein
MKQSSRTWIIATLAAVTASAASAATTSGATAAPLTVTRSPECRPRGGMAIVGCIPGEAERVRATKEWRVDSLMIAWVR